MNILRFTQSHSKYFNYNNLFFNRDIKNIKPKHILYLLFLLKFYLSEFSSLKFSSSESGEISASSVIYLGIFFSLTTYLHSSLKHLRIILFKLFLKQN